MTMNARPIAIGLSLCDYVILEEKTHKVTLVGTFTGMALEEFPSLAPPFSVYAVLTDGFGDGTIELAVTRLDTGEEIHSRQNQIHFSSRLIEVRYHMRLKACWFPVPGLYQFTLFVDGDWVAQRRLRVYSNQEES